MTTIQALREARALVERGWVQKSSAARADGSPVSCLSPEAARWCLYGAIARVTYRASDGVTDGAHDAVSVVAGTGGLVAFNDAPGRTQSEVLALLDRAIAQVEAGSK